MYVQFALKVTFLLVCSYLADRHCLSISASLLYTYNIKLTLTCTAQELGPAMQDDAAREGLAKEYRSRATLSDEQVRGLLSTCMVIHSVMNCYWLNWK
jgi:hypothetical protein